MLSIMLPGTVILKHASTHYYQHSILHFVLLGLWALTYPDGVVETTMWPRARQSNLCGRSGHPADS
jgi:hypothetical protein